MKTDIKHRDAYKDVFLYASVTSHITNSEFSANMETPFKYDDGRELSIYTEHDVITGNANRDFQRNALYNSRGLLIMAGIYETNVKIVGKFNKVKDIVTLYPTKKLSHEEIDLLDILYKHLVNNNISVIIDTDEKNRYRNEIRRKRGDVVRRRYIEH